jgi:hypothetical protein
MASIDAFLVNRTYTDFKTTEFTFITSGKCLGRLYIDVTSISVSIEFPIKNPCAGLATVMISPIDFYDENIDWHVAYLSNECIQELIDFGMKYECDFLCRIDTGIREFRKAVRRIYDGAVYSYHERGGCRFIRAAAWRVRNVKISIRQILADGKRKQRASVYSIQGHNKKYVRAKYMHE